MKVYGGLRVETRESGAILEVVKWRDHGYGLVVSTEIDAVEALSLAADLAEAAARAATKANLGDLARLASALVAAIDAVDEKLRQEEEKLRRLEALIEREAAEAKKRLKEKGVRVEEMSPAELDDIARKHGIRSRYSTEATPFKALEEVRLTLRNVADLRSILDEAAANVAKAAETLKTIERVRRVLGIASPV